MNQPSRVETLRAGLTANQSELLGRLWNAYRRGDSAMLAQVLFFGLQASVAKRELEGLGGSVVHEWGNASRPSYGLSFLGALLAPRGIEIERLLVRYLEWRLTQYAENPMPREIHSDEIQKEMGLTEDQVGELGAALELSGLGLRQWSPGFKTWIADYPRDIHLLGEEPSLLEYIRGQALIRYEPDRPVGARERSGWEHRSRAANQESPYGFVRDPRLRALLERDHGELRAVQKVEAWQSCVFLAGRILEGLLLATLESRQSGTAPDPGPDESEAAIDRGLRDLALAELVSRAGDQGLLGADLRPLLDFARLHRNLIHPGRQLREETDITADQAAIVVSTVEIARRRFERLSQSE